MNTFERSRRTLCAAGVLLLDLGAPGQAPVSLFDIIDAPDDGLMKAMDQINARYGRGTARLGLAQKDGEWHMRRENLSPSFTTRKSATFAPLSVCPPPPP